MTVTIVDYGMGNLRSVQNAFAHLRIDSEVASDPAVIAPSKHILLPGVGSFARAMRTIREKGIDQALYQAVDKGAMVLGICLGMQLLATTGEEDGETQGLGLIPGRVTRIEPGPGLKVPHIGFNTLRSQPNHGGLFLQLEQGREFYFLHSYHLIPEHSGFVIGTCDYGGEVVCAVRRDRIAGVQFHPEKSQGNGLRLLRNFVELH